METPLSVPEIRIGSGWLLDPFFERLFDLYKEKGELPADRVYNSSEAIQKQVVEFKRAWETRAPVLSYMQQVLNLNFLQTTIDVYIVGFIKNAISDPMIISSTKSPDAFRDTLTHEIIHRLLTDNKQHIKTGPILMKLFPDETRRCRNHIVVHALLKKIYLAFLNEPDRLSANKKIDEKFPDYTKAWEIVEKTGEDTIIAGFKALYDM